MKVVDVESPPGTDINAKAKSARWLASVFLGVALFASACAGSDSADSSNTIATSNTTDTSSTTIAGPAVVTDPDLMQLTFSVWKTTGGLAQEFIDIENTGTETVSLSGWKFTNYSSFEEEGYEFTDEALIAPGESIRLNARCGTNRSDTGNFFWCYGKDSGPWDDTGGDATLFDADGEKRLSEGFTASID